MPPLGNLAPLGPRIGAIYRDAWSMYRAHLRFIIATAAIVLAPFAVLDGLGLLRFEASSAQPLAAVVTLVLAVATTGLSGLAAIFYAGLLDHTADAWNAGEGSPSPAQVARRLPWLALLLASVVAFAVEVVALSALVVPGLVLYALFILTGPVLVSEQLQAFPALKRSAGLVRANPGLVTIAVVIPSIAEGSLADFAGLIFGHHLAVELVAEVTITLFVASFLGVVEVITAQHLRRAHPPQPVAANGG